MTDILEVTETQIIRKVAGVDRTFVFLNAYDRAELLRDDLKARQDAHNYRKEKVRDNLKFAGMEKDAIYQELTVFDNDYPESATEEDWINLVNNPLNEIAIYTKSLSKTHEKDAADISKNVSLTLSDKAKICGLTVVNRQEKSETTDPNPPTGTAYSIPAQPDSTGLRENAA